jgi:putative DNA primase/helicase
MSMSREATQLPLTDDGNAIRLLLRYKDLLRWTPGLGWLFWNGSHWQQSENGALQIAREAVRDIAIDAHWLSEQASTCKDSNEPESERLSNRATTMLKWAMASQSEQRIRATLRLAVSEQQLHATLDSWNPDPLKLNCLNGVLDLKTSELMPHDPRYLCTNITRCKFNPNATAPLWMKFVHDVTGGNEDLMTTLKTIAGYAITGSTVERKFFIFTGRGKNGKSAFADTIVYLLGTYADALPSSTLAVKNFMGIPNDVASLWDKRLVVASETDSSHRLNEPFVKSVTGDAHVRARYLRQEFFTFRPTFKLILGTNEEPTISDNSPATWDRLRCVPFKQRFDGPNEIVGMYDKLCAERNGILNWLLEGAREWLDNSTGIPFSSHAIDETEAYKQSQDLIQQFVEENTLDSAGYDVPKRALIEAYNSWSVSLGHQRISARRLGMLLKNKGWIDERRKVASVTTHVWKNKSLTSDQSLSFKPFNSHGFMDNDN